MKHVLCACATTVIGLASFAVPALAGDVEIRAVGVANAMVDEGETAVIDLIFFNDSGETIFRPQPLRVGIGIDFDAGDRADEAFDTRIANNTCANVQQLLHGVGCRFDLEVLTRGVDPDDKPDHGDWKVRVAGVYEYLDPVTQQRQAEFTGLSGIFVRVFDPRPAPAPGTGALALLALAAATFYGSVRTRTRGDRRSPTMLQPD